MVGRTNTGGAGLNLRIVGGQSERSSPVENMIWLNTAHNIPEWLIQNEEPTDPADGLVWISTSNTATINLNVLRINGLTFGVGTPRQYIGGQWSTLGGKVYQDGAWKNLQTFVYNRGTYNENVGGSPWAKWCSAAGSTYSITDYDTYFRTSCNGNSSGRYFSFRTPNKIDFTDVKTVRIKYGAGNMNSDNRFRFSVTTSTANAYNDYQKATSVITNNPDIASPATVDIDVTEVTGESYVAIACYNYNAARTTYVYVDSIELIS